MKAARLVRTNRFLLIRMCALCAALCALLTLAGGCLFKATPQDEPTPAPETPVAQQTSEPTFDPTPTPLPPGAPQTLTVWISDEVMPLERGPLADVINQQFAAFEATHPGVTVEILPKRAQGAGGIEDLLTTSSAVAPSVLPDLVALDVAVLPGVARKGLTLPLEGLLPAELQQDLYPFALQAGQVDEQWMGVQFEAHRLEHAIYNPGKIAVAPLTWTDVYSSGATYVFPAAGQAGLVNDAFLIQYLSATTPPGAALVDKSGNPALDPEALEAVLEFYRQGIERGAIPPAVLEFATVEQCWPMFLQAEVVMSNISSDLYLSVMTGEPTSVPTRDGQAVLLGRGNAWALTARDPHRQALSVELLEWLMDPVNLAAWSEAAGHVPTRRAAFEQMERSTYAAFLYNQLESAVPYASTETHVDIYRAMQQAIDAVLREGIPPETAAANVLKSVNQESP